MKDLSRRSLFGWLAAAPIVAPLVAKALAQDVANETSQLLLEAAEKATNPPFNFYSGGIRWVGVDSPEDYRRAFIGQFDARTDVRVTAQD
jgi:hypothetical protein